MRMLLSGCLAVVVLAVLVIGGALYFGYRAMGPMYDAANGLVEQARAMAESTRAIDDTTAYEPPVDGRLTAEQVTRLLAVHTRVREAMGPRWTEARGRFAALPPEGGGAPSLAALAQALSELGTLPVEARRAHVAALNAEGFSAAEYRWVQLRAYEAAGIEVAAAIDWRALETAVAEGAERVGVRPPTVSAPEVPDENRVLVRPHLAALREWLPFTVLGM